MYFDSRKNQYKKWSLENNKKTKYCAKKIIKKFKLIDWKLKKNVL